MGKIASFFLGLVVGSFLNVCIHRLPQKESILFPSSYCPHCKGKIPFYDNIPILSFLILRGRCRQCKKPIPLRYPLVELLTAFLSLALYSNFGPTSNYLIYFPFAASLLVVTFIDLEHQIIPDLVTLPGIILGFGLSFLFNRHTDSLAGILFGGGSLFLVAFLYQILTKREGMGGGDIKLLAMIGAFLDWKGVGFTLFFSSLLGSVIGSLLMVIKGKNGKYPIPFGPFLSLTSLSYLLWGDKILESLFYFWLWR